MKTNRTLAALALISSAALYGCAVGPDYVRPTVHAPDSYKEMAGWKPAQPRDAEPKGNWWDAFSDPVLNELAQQVSVSNQSLAASEAQYRQARALAQGAR